MVGHFEIRCPIEKLHVRQAERSGGKEQGRAQAVGVVLMRRKEKDLPFRMWLYPLPVILSISIWLFLFIKTGWFALWGSLIAITGIIVYLIINRRSASSAS